MLVAVDSDSDFPPDVVQRLPQLGRDLELDVEAVRALRPDLVLSSLTVPGHERIVDALRGAGQHCLVIEPYSLAEVYRSIRDIADALGVAERGAVLVRDMEAAMPAHAPRKDAPRVLVEWWPKPVIGAARRSWVQDLIERAGARNALDAHDTPTATPDIPIAVDAIVMSWCGVKLENYRADVVLRREGWQGVAAIRGKRVHAITEAFLGRPGPRLVDGYRALRSVVERFHASAPSH